MRPRRRGRPPFSDETRVRIKAMQRVDTLRQRRDMVRALRVARLPVPDEMARDVVAPLASTRSAQLPAR